MVYIQLKKASVAILVFAVVIAVAIILGTEAGDFINKRRYLQNREKSTATKLAQMQTLEIGGKLPDHVFEDLEGNEIRLSDLIADRTVVCFFDIGCGGCLLELEEMQSALEDSLHRRFILISHDDRVDLQEARDDYSIKAPILWDQNSFYARNLKIASRPFNVGVDSTLTIGWIVIGKMSRDELREIISDQ